MRVSSSTFILFFNLILGGIASYIGGSLLSTWMHYEVVSFSDTMPRKSAIIADKLPFDPGKSEDYFKIVLEGDYLKLVVLSNPPSH